MKVHSIVRLKRRAISILSRNAKRREISYAFMKTYGRVMELKTDGREKFALIAWRLWPGENSIRYSRWVRTSWLTNLTRYQRKT